MAIQFLGQDIIRVCPAGDTSCEDRSGKTPSGRVITAPSKNPSQIDRIMRENGIYAPESPASGIVGTGSTNAFDFFSESGLIYMIGAALVTLGFLYLRK